MIRCRMWPRACSTWRWTTRPQKWLGCWSTESCSAARGSTRRRPSNARRTSTRNPTQVSLEDGKMPYLVLLYSCILSWSHLDIFHRTRQLSLNIHRHSFIEVNILDMPSEIGSAGKWPPTSCVTREFYLTVDLLYVTFQTRLWKLPCTNIAPLF